MKHIPRLPGRPQAMCSTSMPASTMDVNESDCPECVWGAVAMLMTTLTTALRRLQHLHGMEPKKAQSGQGAKP